MRRTRTTSPPSRRSSPRVASGRRRLRPGSALWWGLGHAVTLVAFGIPILVAERYLPEDLQRGAETAVAALIVFLAVRLLVRWRHGAFASSMRTRTSVTGTRSRTSAGAFGIGLVHGMGGSAGVGVLLLAAIPSRETRARRARRPRPLHRRFDDDRHDRLRRCARCPRYARAARDRRARPRLSPASRSASGTPRRSGASRRIPF